MQTILNKDYQNHDKNFRRFIRIMWLIKAFLRRCLPKSALKTLDLGSLQILDGQLITRHSHRNLNTDFVCRIDLKEEEGFVLILIEHQSRADKMMPLRMLRYAGELMKEYSDEGKSNRPCPLVIPIVFYTGRSAYRFPQHLDGITSGDTTFENKPIQLDFTLVQPKDLSDAGDEDGKALSLFAQSFELAQNPEVFSLLKMMEALDRLEGEKYVEFIEGLEEYLFKESECKLKERDRATLKSLIASSKGENNMPSLAEVIKDVSEEVGEERGIILGKREGKREGLIEGEKKGKHQGKREALLEVAKSMMCSGMAFDLISEHTGLERDCINQLKNSALTIR